MNVRAALYLRVSTDQQTTGNQYQELWAAAARAGWTIAEVFEDNGVSGAKGRDERPGFDRLHRAIIRREIDVIMAWSVDRLGRRLLRRAARGGLRSLPASAGSRYDHARRPRAVSDARGVR